MDEIQQKKHITDFETILERVMLITSILFSKYILSSSSACLLLLRLPRATSPMQHHADIVSPVLVEYTKRIPP